MSQEPTDPKEGQEPKPADAGGDPKPSEPEGQEPKVFDEDYVKQLRSEAADWRTKAQAAQAKVSEFEDRDKTEQQRAQETATQAEQRAQDAERKFLRLKVGTEKGLPTSLAERLAGDDEDAMAKDADRLLEAIKANGGPADFGGGARTPAQTNDMDSMIRRQAGR